MLTKVDIRYDKETRDKRIQEYNNTWMILYKSICIKRTDIQYQYQWNAEFYKEGNGRLFIPTGT